MATFKVNSGLVCRGCAHVRQMRAILVNCIFSTLPQDPFAVIVHAPSSTSKIYIYIYIYSYILYIYIKTMKMH